MKTTEDKLFDLYQDLKDNAYNSEYHNYHFKETNQIIRKHFEAIAPPKGIKDRIARLIKWIVKITMRILGFPFAMFLMFLKDSQLWLMYGGNITAGERRKGAENKRDL